MHKITSNRSIFYRRRLPFAPSTTAMIHRLPRLPSAPPNPFPPSLRGRLFRNLPKSTQFCRLSLPPPSHSQNHLQAQMQFSATATPHSTTVNSTPTTELDPRSFAAAPPCLRRLPNREMVSSCDVPDIDGMGGD